MPVPTSRAEPGSAWTGRIPVPTPTISTSPGLVTARAGRDPVSRLRRCNSAAHLLCALITQLPVSLQRTIDDVFQLWRQVWIQPYRRDAIPFQNGVKDDSRTFTSASQGASCHLVTHDSE